MPEPKKFYFDGSPVLTDEELKALRRAWRMFEFHKSEDEKTCPLCGEDAVRDPWGGKEMPEAAVGKVVPSYCRTHLEPWMERRGYRKPEVKKVPPPAPAYKTLHDAQMAMSLELQQRLWGRQQGQSVSKTDIWNLMNAAGVMNPESYFKEGTFAGLVPPEGARQTYWWDMDLVWLLKRCWAWATKERGGEE